MALSPNEIVTTAMKGTENRLKPGTDPDPHMELYLLIQEMLHENRFWWAKRTGTFNTAANDAVYDLSSAAGGENIIDAEEIIKAYRIDSATEFTELQPIVSEDDELAALHAVTAEKPSSYVVGLTDWQTFRLGAPADGIYTIRLIYWAGLNTDFADFPSANVVPYVPGPLHYGLVYGLKRRIYEFLFGQKDTRYIVAAANWERFLKSAGRKPSFTTARMREFSTGDSVRATG